MSVKQVARGHYQEIVDRTAKAIGPSGRTIPPEGWIATVRKAIGMTGAQLSSRLGVTRARISALEKAELSGTVTLQTIMNAARAMNCTFVYAIVPDNEIMDVIRTQAYRKATALVTRAADHMALERQSLPAKLNQRQIRNIAEEWMREIPRSLWTEPQGKNE